jgi:hypothetical protein
VGRTLVARDEMLQDLPHSKAGADGQRGQKREVYGDLLQQAQGFSSGGYIVYAPQRF